MTPSRRERAFRRALAAAPVLLVIAAGSNQAAGGGWSARGVAVAIALTLAPLVILAFSSVAVRLYAAGFAFWGALYGYYARQLGFQPGPELIDDLFNSNWSEVVRIASARVIVLLAASVVGTLVMQALLERLMRRARPGRAVAVTAAALVLAGAGACFAMRPSDGFPSCLIGPTRDYLVVLAHAEKLRRNKVELPSRMPFRYRGPDDLVVVLVRGESARAQDFSLLGYRERMTTPLLSARADVVPLPHVFSYANHTAAAVPYMFTRATREDASPTVGESSFISVFRSLGFRTVWVGADRTNFAEFASPILAVAREADVAAFQGEVIERCRDLGAFDAMKGGCVWDSRSFIYGKDEIGRARQPLLVVIETNGSHIPYYIIAPPEFHRFLPECHKEVEEIRTCSREAVRNDYDNTVLYTDYLVDDMIETLKDKTAIVFYVSDHGESLGEDGQYGHGYLIADGFRDTREQRNVAALAWMSPRARAALPGLYEQLRAHAAEYMGHDVVFHSMLGCSGVSSPGIDEARDLCSPRFGDDGWLRARYPAN